MEGTPLASEIFHTASGRSSNHFVLIPSGCEPSAVVAVRRDGSTMGGLEGGVPGEEKGPR